MLITYCALPGSDKTELWTQEDKKRVFEDEDFNGVGKETVSQGLK